MLWIHFSWTQGTSKGNRGSGIAVVWWVNNGVVDQQWRGGPLLLFSLLNFLDDEKRSRGDRDRKRRSRSRSRSRSRRDRDRGRLVFKCIICNFFHLPPLLRFWF